MTTIPLVPSSEFPEIGPISEKTVPEYILGKAKYFAEQGRDFWSVDGLTDEKRYFSKLPQETSKIANGLCRLGLQKHDIVLYMIKDLCKLHILFLGVWKGNGVLRASYPEDDPDTILARVKESQCKFIVCEEDNLVKCEGLAKAVEWKLNIITVNRSGRPGVASLEQFLEEDDQSDCPESLLTEEDPAIIFCTSGTTGLPKGAIHTHKSLLYMIRSIEPGPYLLHKSNLVATKATHIIASVLPLVLLARGKTAIVVSNLTKESVFEAADKYKPGFAFAFPTFLVAMADAHGKGEMDFGSVEVILTAGASLTPAIRESLEQLPNLKDIVVAYGLTEGLTCATSAVLMDDDKEKKGVLGYRDLPDFSVGKVCPGSQFQFINPETLEVVGAREQGEICVKSPGLFHSYLNNPQATEKSFLNGYFRTGDIGYFDENGFIYIIDRLKEIFKYFNDHIAPTEVESVIGRHSQVAEVCVVGIPDPGGHIPRAFVRLIDNSESKTAIAREIQEFANAKLAPYKQLKGGVFVIDELPKGKTGKISRQILAELDVSLHE